MSAKNVTKQLLTMQDVAAGYGEVSQVRGATSLVLNKVDINMGVSSVAALLTIDTTKFLRARVYASAVLYADYVYSVGDFTGVSPDDDGSWLVVDAEESAARIAKDGALEAATSAEVVDRVAQGVSLQDNIDSEATTRASEDVLVTDAFIAADSALVAAYAAGSGAALVGTAAGQTVQIALDSLTAGQTGGIIVFTTYALLTAYTPTASQQTTSFKVTNDPTSNLNGYYSWVSGTTYTKDADDVVDVIDAANTSDAVSGSAVNTYVQATVDTTSFPNQEFYDYAVVDLNNAIAIGVKKDGSVRLGDVSTNAITVLEDASLTKGASIPSGQKLVIGALEQEEIETDNYLWAVADSAGAVSIGVKPDGHVSVSLDDISLDNMTVNEKAYFGNFEQEQISTDNYLWAISDNLGSVALGVKPDGTVHISDNGVVNKAYIDTSNLQVYGTDKDNVTRQLTATGTHSDVSVSGEYAVYKALRSGVTTRVTRKLDGSEPEKLWLPVKKWISWGDSTSAGVPTGYSAAYSTQLKTIAGTRLDSASYVGGGAFGGASSAQVADCATGIRRVVAQFNFPLMSDGSAASELTWENSLQDWRNQINGIWVGHNSPDAVNTPYDVDRIVNTLLPLNARFVVMPIMYSVNREYGTALRGELIKINQLLKSKYPNNYVDVNAALALSGDGSATDNANIADGIVPASLRSDSIHLTPAGYNVVAQAVYTFLINNNWI